jgi:hypothetical protein
MEVRHIPDCYEPNIKTVAILPFKNESERARAGLIVARNLAKELRANGTYMVIDPNEVSKILEQSGQKIGDIDYKSQAQIVRETVKSDAFITGSVVEDTLLQTQYFYGPYDIFPYEYGRLGPMRQVFPYEFAGVGPFYHYDYDTRTYTQAFVKVRSSLINSSSGTLICTTPGVVEGYGNLAGFDPNRTKKASASALDEAVKQIEYQFAIVPTKINISNDSLKTASAKQNEKWKYTSTFSRADNQMYAVVKLPDAAAKNDFKLTVTPYKQVDNVLLSKDFTWQTGDKEKSISFAPGSLTPGRYFINLYSLDELVISKTFSLKE